MPNGVYIIKAYFAGDSSYKPSDATTSCRGDLTVVPEYAYGGLIVLSTCFIAFAVFKHKGFPLPKTRK